MNTRIWVYIVLHKSMSWSHIQAMTQKATYMLNFIKHTLHKCDSTVKATAYTTLIQPILEYAAAVWDSTSLPV